MLAVAIAIILASIQPASAAVAFVRSTSCSNLGGTTVMSCTLSSSATAGNVLIISTATKAACGATHYVYAASSTSGTSIDYTTSCAGSGYVAVVGGETTATVTDCCGTSMGGGDILVTEWSGVSTSSPIDKHNFAGFGGSCTSSALTPTQSGDGFITYSDIQGDTLTGYSTSPVTTTATVTTTGTGVKQVQGYSVYASNSAITGTITYSGGNLVTCGAILLAPTAPSSGGTAPTTPVSPGGGAYPGGRQQAVGDALFESLVGIA